MDPVERTASGATGRARERRLLRFLALTVVAAGCAIPGRFYLVAPAISGTVRGGEIRRDAASLMLRVTHRETPNLYDRQQARLAPDGHFSFDPVELVVAGHEYSKYYRVFLHLQMGQQDRVIWRAAFSRRALAGAIRLDCDLERPVRHGQPCWVSEPLLHPWLVAEGERTYRRLCADCHGLDGGGDRSAIAAPGSTPPDLRAIASRRGGRFDRAEIAEWIEGRSLPAAHGTRLMPIWGEHLSVEYERYVEGDELIGATLDPLVAYLQSLQDAD